MNKAVNLCEESQVIDIRLHPLPPPPSLGDASYCLNPTGHQGAKAYCCALLSISQDIGPGERVERVGLKMQRKYQ